MFIKKVALVALSALPFMLSGCNTAKGFGMDVEDLGRVIQGKESTHHVSTIKKAKTKAASTTTTFSSMPSSTATTTTTYSNSVGAVPAGTATYSDGVTYSNDGAAVSVTSPNSSSGTEVYSYPYTDGGGVVEVPKGINTPAPSY